MGQRRHLLHLVPALIAISPTHIESEVCVEVSEYNETGDSIPPAPKRPLIDSAPECRDVARYVQSSVHISDAEKYQLLTDPFTRS